MRSSSAPCAARSRRRRRRHRVVAALCAILACAAVDARAAAAQTENAIVIGAKKFTESTILAEIMAQLLEARTGRPVERRYNLAGTQVCFAALRDGAIDLYPEYTGTGLRNILGRDDAVGVPAQTFAIVEREFRERFDLTWLAPFGFNNTYVLLTRAETAARLGLRNISDLAAQPMRFGVSHEFLQRGDGMPGLRRVYGLNEASTVGLEHDLAYLGLRDGAIDIADGYSTDAKIARYGFTVLRDDRLFFPPYEAAPLARADLLARLPDVAGILRVLAGRIDDATMQRLNYRVEEEGVSPRRVAAEFLHGLGLAGVEVVEAARARGLLALLWQRRSITLDLTLRHLALTGAAVALAALLGLPLGIAASRRPRLSRLALAAAGALQTIPSIALLAFMLPLFGIGTPAALMALFLYGLLPILRNTVTGLHGVDPFLLEVGRGLGMREGQLLRRVQLPLAAPVILAGVRTATVISVGTATLAAFVGAGGLGDPIVTGLTMTDFDLVLSGALPAAALALALDALLARLERAVTPRGLAASV
jgi:osmoprotectant transport system permease protein